MTEQKISVVEFTEVENEKVSGSPLISKDLSLIGELEVELEVEIGSTLITVNDLYSLKKGNILKLDSQIDQPLKIRLGEKIVAEGLLVAIEDQYGIELTQVASIE